MILNPRFYEIAPLSDDERRRARELGFDPAQARRAGAVRRRRLHRDAGDRAQLDRTAS